MDTKTRFYKIERGGVGGFMCPPGHWNHSWELNEYSSSRSRTVQGSYTIDYAESDEANASETLRQQVARIKAESSLVLSEAWVREVYGYFRNMWVPESGSHSASDLISYNEAEISAGKAETLLRETFAKRYPPLEVPDNYRRGVTPVYGRRRGFEVTAKRDGSRVYVYALADDGTRYDADHLSEYATVLEDAFDNVRHEPMSDKHAGRIVADVREVPEPKDPETHAAVACVRRYFPDHQPRLDLIENPGKGYGSWPCSKCGEKVQYEAKLDAYAIVSTRVSGSGMTHWSYKTECDKGGKHEREY